MRIFVTVLPRGQRERVEQVDREHYRVVVREPPERGKANQAVVRLLAEFFGVPSSRVSIVSGHTSRHKVIDITL